MFNNLVSRVFCYYGFIAESVRRDFQSRYQSSFLGALWLVLQPIMMISVYTIVFSELIRARLPNMNTPFAYSIYLCSGVLSWGLFTETLVGLVSVFLVNASILKKLNFPRICLPIIVSVSSFINFLIIFSFFILFMIATNNFPGWIFFLTIPVLMIQVIFTIGLGVILGIMNVFVRDVGQFVSVLLPLWFWFTPIVYTKSTLPYWAKNILLLNPMAIIVEGYQSILLYQKSPDWLSLTVAAGTAIVLLLISCRMFKKYSADIMDEI